MISEEDYDLIMEAVKSETTDGQIEEAMKMIQKGPDGLIEAIKMGLGGSRPTLNLPRMCWELTRPGAYCIRHELIQEIRKLSYPELDQFKSCVLVECRQGDGELMIAVGVMIDHNDGVHTTVAGEGVFEAVAREFDKMSLELDLRDPETGEQLLFEGKLPPKKDGVGDRLSDVVVKDIDAQVSKFSAELDSVFGTAPSPDWPAPKPPEGGET